MNRASIREEAEKIVKELEAIQKKVSDLQYDLQTFYTKLSKLKWSVMDASGAKPTPLPRKQEMESDPFDELFGGGDNE